MWLTPIRGWLFMKKTAKPPMAAASLTKLMTMILMLESYQDQLDTISITAPGYIYDYLYGKNASTADIWKDETHTLRSLLYAMLLPSANEAAYIVADYMSGSSIDNFVAMMNDEAARIGCTGTTFTDPCGLDPGNVTTARDAYLLVRVAMGYDAFAQAITEAKRAIHCCPVCQNLTEGDGPCSICASPRRDASTICVVADPPGCGRAGARRRGGIGAGPAGLLAALSLEGEGMFMLMEDAALSDEADALLYDLLPDRFDGITRIQYDNDRNLNRLLKSMHEKYGENVPVEFWSLEDKAWYGQLEEMYLGAHDHYYILPGEDDAPDWRKPTDRAGRLRRSLGQRRHPRR